MRTSTQFSLISTHTWRRILASSMFESLKDCPPVSLFHRWQWKAPYITLDKFQWGYQTNTWGILRQTKRSRGDKTQSLSGQQEAGAVQRQRDVPPLPTLQPRVPVRQLFLLQMREKCPMPCPHPRSTFNSGMEGPRRNQLWLAGSYFFPKWEKNARCPVPIPDPHFIRGWRGREETN